jgi:hypothetical protein
METAIDTSEEKKDLTLDMVMQVVKLSKLQIRNLFTAVLKKSVPPGDGIFSRDDLFCVLVADMLERLAFLKAEQRLLIVEGVWTVKSQPLPPDAPCCLNQLVFADGRYCTWTGHTGFVDLETGDEFLGILPSPPLESIAYNLDELYRRGVLQIENKAGFHAKKFDARSLDESGDVCERPADAVP